MINNVNLKTQQPPKKQQTVAAQRPEVYNNMKQWQESHENNIQAAINFISNGYDEETVMDIFFEKSDELGETFDFMEGKDPNNENEYNEQIFKLGQGEVSDKDINENGVVEPEEYIYDETKGLEDGADKDYATVVSQALFQIIDQLMGNGDETLDADEFAQFYMHMDEYTGTGETLRDGKLDINLASEYPEYLAMQLPSVQEAYEEFINQIS